MGRLKKKAEGYDGYGATGPPTAGFFYNYESDVQPELIPGTGEKQFNTLNREDNYWKLDQPYTDNEWRLQEQMGTISRLRPKVSSKNDNLQLYI